MDVLKFYQFYDRFHNVKDVTMCYQSELLYQDVTKLCTATTSSYRFPDNGDECVVLTCGNKQITMWHCGKKYFINCSNLEPEVFVEVNEENFIQLFDKSFESYMIEGSKYFEQVCSVYEDSDDYVVARAYKTTEDMPITSKWKDPGAVFTVVCHYNPSTLLATAMSCSANEEDQLLLMRFVLNPVVIPIRPNGTVHPEYLPFIDEFIKNFWI